MKTLINFKLILISDSGLNKNLYKIILQACKAGVKAVQLREKNISPSEMLKVARKIRSITKKYNSKLIVNDRFDIALLTKADGLHSPEGGIRPKQIKKKNKFIIGKSVHSLSSAIEAEKNGYDYAMFGPVFRTPSKVRYGKPQGLEKLKKVCSMANIPVFAVGGINPVRAQKCIKAGAFGVAVIREIMQSKNVEKTVRELLKSVRSVRRTPTEET